MQNANFHKIDVFALSLNIDQKIIEFRIDLLAVLAANLGPSWEPRWLGIRKNTLEKFRRSDPKEDPNTILLLSLGALLASIFGGQGSIFGDVWKMFRAS